MSTPNPLAHFAKLKCHWCGAPDPKSKCSRCNVAYYCGLACQKPHWKTHKVACAVDQKAEPKESEEERDSLRFDDRCLHGGPSPAECMPLMMALGQLVEPLLAAGSSAQAAAQLTILERFALSGSGGDARTPRICASMAMDAFADNNGGTARLFLRIAAFCEGFLAGRQEFISGLRSPDQLLPQSCQAYFDFIKRTTSRSGLLAELRARATCKFLQPKRSV